MTERPVPGAGRGGDGRNITPPIFFLFLTKRKRLCAVRGISEYVPTGMERSPTGSRRTLEIRSALSPRLPAWQKPRGGSGSPVFLAPLALP